MIIAGKWRRAFVLLLAALVSASVVTGLSATNVQDSAVALSGSDFDPGYIISDTNFYDAQALSSAQIQAFLDSRVSSCLNGRCLNVSVVPVGDQSTRTSSSTGNLICSAFPGGNLRVSELIYRIQVACGISAKVILVMLQKEQGLITNRAPSDLALSHAMGMACPDTAPCDPGFAGLARQLISGSAQLKTYKAGRFAKQPGLQYVQYNPNAACGGTNVNVRNYATAALYSYTPYQPNASALANLGGTGNSCSSYGNRNFWVYYTQWFGPTAEVPCTVNPSRDITRYWSENGGASGALGAPVSPGIAGGPSGTTVGNYANGDVYCTPRIGPVSLLGAFRVKYDALGAGYSSLGSPISTSTPFSASGVNGSLQEFQNGTMLTSTTTGTFAVLHGAIRSAWSTLGGSGGSLGWPIGDQETVSVGVRQQFKNGLLTVTKAGTAIVLNGSMGTYWAAGTNSTQLGSPTGVLTSLSAGGVSGSLQNFENGTVLSSTSTGTFAVLNGPVRAAWGAQNGTAGDLGWPIADAEILADGYRQQFQGGTIFAASTGGGGSLLGDMATYWNTGTNAARLGYPTGPAGRWSAGDNVGTLQYFEHGMVLASTATGVHAVLNGPVRDGWGLKGGSGGSLGWPIGEQEIIGGQVRQQFQRGTLTVDTGVEGAVADYVATGSNASKLGAASSQPVALTAGGITGLYQSFLKGMVLSTQSTGTFAVLNGPIRNSWGAADGTAGVLGWPTADQEAYSGGVRQKFQGGSISVPTGGIGYVLTGFIGTYWQTGSNSARLGAPTSSASVWSAGGVTGSLQYFQKGMVLSSVTTGTFSVLSGGVRDAWGSAGGSGGELGWPIADQESYSGGVRQAFQGGKVIVPTGRTGAVLFGAIGDYWASGSNATRLGAPTASPVSWTAGGTAGLLQDFQKGTVLSASFGTHAVLNGPIRNAWGTDGGTGGSLGWPTGDQETLPGGGVRQLFQRGLLVVTGEGVAVPLAGTYFSYWSTGSHPSDFGSPSAPVVSWNAGGVSGSYLTFDNGMVMSSTTTGTVGVLNGPIRTLWGANDGSGGSLGWPVADQESISGGIQQRFQRGVIVVPVTGAPYVVSG